MRLLLKPRLNYSSPISIAGLIEAIFFIKKNPLSGKLFPEKKVFYTNHARTGIRLILSSLNLPVKAKVGVMAYNCHTVFRSIQEAGMEPVFIDINYDFKIDVDDLSKKSHKIDALIVTHLFGIPNSIENVRKVFKKGPIIEDCAHSFLSTYNNEIVGLKGDAAVYSIGKVKFPSIGDGGIVVISNKIHYSLFENNYNTLPTKEDSKFLLLIKNIVLFILHNPFIYANFTKPVLKKIDSSKDLNKKFEHAEYKIAKYNKLIFENLDYNFMSFRVQRFQSNGLNNLSYIKSEYKKNIIKVPNFPEGCNYFMLPILVKKPEKLISKFEENGIELGRHFSNAISWASKFGYKQNECPNAEYVAKHVVTIPTHYKFL